jgi:hypothetical protein
VLVDGCEVRKRDTDVNQANDACIGRLLENDYAPGITDGPFYCDPSDLWHSDLKYQIAPIKTIPNPVLTTALCSGSACQMRMEETRESIGIVTASTTLEIPVVILSRIIDFKCYEEKRDQYDRLFILGV